MLCCVCSPQIIRSPDHQLGTRPPFHSCPPPHSLLLIAINQIRSSLQKNIELALTHTLSIPHTSYFISHASHAPYFIFHISPPLQFIQFPQYRRYANCASCDLWNLWNHLQGSLSRLASTYLRITDHCPVIFQSRPYDTPGSKYLTLTAMGPGLMNRRRRLYSYYDVCYEVLHLSVLGLFLLFQVLYPSRLYEVTPDSPSTSVQLR
ncbi:hypothetical protein F4814DRAFT_361736 [Daldinia grandis]|nr:hypothetical protein F4814DRAFT_361736 [Daldinia grandis]